MKTKTNTALLFTLLVFFQACHSDKEITEKNKQVEYNIVAVEEGQPTTRISLPGELTGYFETNIYPKVNSYVKTLYTDIGQKVAKGQILAELEAPELSSKLNEGYSKYKAAEAIFLNSKGKLKRLEQTNKTEGAVSPYDLEFARTMAVSDSLNFIAAEANYHSLLEMVAYLKVTAPFEGIITERNLSPGAFVGPSEKEIHPMFTIKNESKLRLRISIPEKHVAGIKCNEEIKFRVEGYPDKQFSGKITRTSSNINTQLRSETVEIEIENNKDLLLPGMFAKVEIPLTRNEKTVVVPESSVATSMEHCFIIKVINNKAKIIDIQKGNTTNGMVEIFGNIHPGDLILKEASEDIKDGEILSQKI